MACTGIDNTIHCWTKHENWTMPKTIYQFGYVLYRERVIITFGGRDETNETIDNIFYLDLLNKNDGWKESKLKCPKSSTYNALLMDDNIVHIVPFYVHKDHFSIPIKKLLPNKLIDQINLDIDIEENINQFGLQYKDMIKLKYKYLRNKIILSILISILISIIGLILYFTAKPHFAGIIVFSAGILIAVISLIYARFHKPTQTEYLLY